MIIIIDGYNLLKQVLRDKEIGDCERERFIKQLSRYARKKGHNIVLVFDAGPYVRVSKEMRDGVQVVYSGSYESADDYIHRYVEKHRAYDMLLVSSDRELRKKAAGYSVEAIPSEEFYPVLLREIGKEVAHKPTSNQEVSIFKKISEDSSAELDSLMIEFMDLKPPQKDDEPRTSMRRQFAHKVSKKERKLLEKIKKL